MPCATRHRGPLARDRRHSLSADRPRGADRAGRWPISMRARPTRHSLLCWSIRTIGGPVRRPIRPGSSSSSRSAAPRRSAMRSNASAGAASATTSCIAGAIRPSWPALRCSKRTGTSRSASSSSPAASATTCVSCSGAAARSPGADVVFAKLWVARHWVVGREGAARLLRCRLAPLADRRARRSTSSSATTPSTSSTTRRRCWRTCARMPATTAGWRSATSTTATAPASRPAGR